MLNQGSIMYPVSPVNCLRSWELKSEDYERRQVSPFHWCITLSEKKVLPSTFFGDAVCQKWRTLVSTWKDRIVHGWTMIGILGST